jgi:hypothetical protein
MLISGLLVGNRQDQNKPTVSVSSKNFDAVPKKNCTYLKLYDALSGTT